MQQRDILLKNLAQSLADIVNFQSTTETEFTVNQYDSGTVNITCKNDNSYFTMCTLYFDEVHDGSLKYTLHDTQNLSSKECVLRKVFKEELENLLGTPPSLGMTESQIFAMYNLPMFVSHDDWGTLQELPNREFTPCAHPRIFFDLDGTCAKFNVNATMEEVYSKGYYRHLDTIQNIVDTAEELVNRGYDVYIESKAPFNGIQDKLDWIDEKMPFIKKENIILSPSAQVIESSKVDFISGFCETDVLIDDYSPNSYDWKEKGGTAINCHTDINNLSSDIPNIFDYVSAKENADIVERVILERTRMMFDKNIEIDEEEIDL